MKPDAFSTQMKHLEHAYQQRVEGLAGPNWQEHVSERQLRTAIVILAADCVGEAPSDVTYSYTWDDVAFALGIRPRDFVRTSAIADYLRSRRSTVNRWVAETLPKG